MRYGQQAFHESDITNISEAAKQDVKGKLAEFTLGNIFLPPAQNPTITMPQYNGGTDWGGAAYDPEHRKLYVNCSNEAEWISMVPAKPKTEIAQYELGRQLFRSVCAACHGNNSPKTNTLAKLGNLQDHTADKSVEYLQNILRKGKAQMPAFPMLSDDEVDALIAFLKREGKNNMLSTAQLELSFSNDIPWVATGHNELKDYEGFPANKPPWGTLTSIDLDEGKIDWQVPLGTYPELEKRGHDPTGTFNMGGPVVTAGGLVFMAGTMDERIRAFDKDTGEVLWEFQMEAGGYATPATFEIDGKQFLVIGAGGGGKPGTKSGDVYYCFGL